MARDAILHDGLPVEHPRGVRRSRGLVVPEDEPSLFSQATSVPMRKVVGMFHSGDGIESQAAAVRAKPGVHALQQRILAVLAQKGPLTALELETLPELSDAGDYAVRRRCSDLRGDGRVVKVGTRGGAGLLDIPPRGK